MTEYNFWADLLDTFQSSADWVKVVWLLIPPGFVLGLIAIFLRYRVQLRRIAGHDGGGPGRIDALVVREGEVLLPSEREPRALPMMDRDFNARR